jgi:hypothetical protein
MPLRNEGMRHFLGIVTAALMLSHAAAAQEAASDLPVYDVDKYCKNEADTYGKDPTMIEVCLDEEQKAYDKLKNIWSSLNKTVKTYCEQDLHLPETLSSYYRLMVCIGHELKEDEELHDFKFKR